MSNISANEVLEILDKLEFFQGQRAGRELWADKSESLQDIDIANFNSDINIIKDFLKDNYSLLYKSHGNGTTLNLPCCIGDTLYYIGYKCDVCEEDDCYGCPYNRNGAKRDERFIHEFKVEQFRVRNNSIYMVNTDAIFYSREISIDVKEISNIVFFTREEAEAKLVELTELGVNKDEE